MSSRVCKIGEGWFGPIEGIARGEKAIEEGRKLYRFEHCYVVTCFPKFIRSRKPGKAASDHDHFLWRL
jgi:hypothetical protein